MRQIGAMVLLLGVVLLSLAPTETLKGTSAGAEACPEIVRKALTTTNNLCQNIGRNQACYGHLVLQAQPQPDVTQLKFDQEGDVVNVDLLQSLRLSVMDAASDAWGVALMRLQANLPDSLEKNITLLLFGDVQVTNQMTVTAPLEVTVKAASNVNARQWPVADAWVLASLTPGQTVMATGRLADSSWIRIALPDNGGTAWVATWLLSSAGDLESLSVVEPTSQYYGPMQAFYFKSGQNDSFCAEAPDSGLLVQTPEGVAQVTLLINEVNVQIGSTVYFQAQPGGNMTVRVVEGGAQVTAANITYKVIAGAQLTVPVDENLKPSGPPTLPTAYDLADVRALPVSSLERAITIHPPASSEELAAALHVVKPAADEPTVEGESTPTPTTEAGAPGQGDTASTPVPSPTSIPITICHDLTHTITINSDALAAHLAHGDTIGACP